MDKNSEARNTSAIWHFELRSDAMTQVRSQLSTWLDEKDIPGIKLDLTGHYPHRTKDLWVVHAENSESVSLKVKLIENNDESTWTSTFVCHFPKDKRESPWLNIEIDTDSETRPRAPRLVRYFTEIGLIVDGGNVLTPTPWIARDISVGDLIRSISEPSRRVPYFVAATDRSRDVDKFFEKTKKWSRYLAGFAQFVVLDPDASILFRKTLGDSMAVDSWTIRSFLPGWKKGDKDDARRHKTMGQQWLREPESKIATKLSWIAQSYSHRLIQLPEVHRTIDRLQRLEDATLFSQISKRTPTIESSLSKDDLIQIGLTSEKLRQKIDELQSEVELRRAALIETFAALEARQRKFESARLDQENQEATNADLEVEIGILQDEQRVLIKERNSQDRRIDWLESKLDESVRYTEQFSSPEEEILNRPQSWEELLSRVPDLREYGIVYMGDPKDCLEIDEYDHVGNIVRMTWDCLLLLVDYREAKLKGDWSSDVENFIKSGQASRVSVSAKKHAENETGFTKRRYNREFPVPKTISPTGFATMNAHFKLWKVQHVDPRMYYFDAVQKEGFIYVGYLGLHLTNRLT